LFNVKATMNSVGSGKGARFHLKHDPDTPTEFSILAHNELEVMRIEVEDEGRSATCFLDGKIISKIQYNDDQVITLSMVAKSEKKNKTEKEKKEKKVKSQESVHFLPLGEATVVEKGILVYQADVEKYDSKLQIEFTNEGSEFTVTRDNYLVLVFASNVGPIGKSGGIARVPSGEKKSFVLSLLALLYIAQVSFSEKERLFNYEDKGQKPILRTDSLNTSAERVHVNLDIKNPVKNVSDESKSPRGAQSPRGVESGHAANRRIKMVSKEPNVPQSFSDSRESESNSQVFSIRDKSADFDGSLSMANFVECWSQLEALASHKSDQQ